VTGNIEFVSGQAIKMILSNMQNHYFRGIYDGGGSPPWQDVGGLRLFLRKVDHDDLRVFA
jgi:hypothetical protein